MLTKKKSLIYLVLSCIFLLSISWFYLTKVLDDRPKIKGRYLSYPEHDLSHFEIGLATIVEGKKIDQYETSLKSDGSFSIKVNELGNCLIVLRSCGHDSVYEWILSNRMGSHSFNLKKNKTYIMDELYISKSIDIYTPQSDTVIDITDLDNLIFQWEEIPFADFYSLFIWKKNIDKQEELVIDAYTTSTLIKHNELQNREISDTVNYKEVIKNKAKVFGSKLYEFGPGTYRIYVNAYKINKKGLLTVSNSIGEPKFILKD